MTTLTEPLLIAIVQRVKEGLEEDAENKPRTVPRLSYQQMEEAIALQDTMLIILTKERNSYEAIVRHLVIVFKKIVPSLGPILRDGVREYMEVHKDKTLASIHSQLLILWPLETAKPKRWWELWL